MSGETPAENRCDRCAHEWRDKPGQFAEHKECPRCGSLHWTWLNFARDFAR